MDRPTSRPATPLTIPEIVAGWLQHFVIDKAPWCGSSSGCTYTGTGCGVGVFFTAEDAEAFDHGEALEEAAARRPDIYAAYFGSDPIVYNALEFGQVAHDGEDMGVNPDLPDDMAHAAIYALALLPR